MYIIVQSVRVLHFKQWTVQSDRLLPDRAPWLLGENNRVNTRFHK
jgi:hypothetical protein